MEFKAIVDPKARSACACAIVGVYENGDLGVAAHLIDAQTGGLIRKLHGAGDFAGKLGDSLLLTRPAGARAARVLLIGLGPRASFGRKPYRKALQAAAQAAAKTGAADAAVYLALEQPQDLDLPYRARIVAETFLMQRYKIPDLKTGTKPKPARLKSVSVALPDAKAARSGEQGLQVGTAIGSGLALARDLANLPPNICTPSYIGSQALKLAKQWPRIRTRVLDRAPNQGAKNGSLPRRDAGLGRTAAAHRL